MIERWNDEVQNSWANEKIRIVSESLHLLKISHEQMQVFLNDEMV